MAIDLTKKWVEEFPMGKLVSFEARMENSFIRGIGRIAGFIDQGETVCAKIHTYDPGLKKEVEYRLTVYSLNNDKLSYLYTDTSIFR